MLTWDDEVKPSLPTTQSRGYQQTTWMSVLFFRSLFQRKLAHHN